MGRKLASEGPKAGGITLSRFAWRWGWLVAIFAVAAALLWLERAPVPAHYVTVAAERGSLIRAVTATGTVNPVVTVQVGTYVSGPIVKLYCDFNTEVKKGQICAKIDPRPYQITVEQARANLANGRAQLKKDQASLIYDRLEFTRNESLLKENVVSQDTVDSARSTADQAVAQIELDRASIQQQEAALHAAEVNLGFTDIISGHHLGDRITPGRIVRRQLVRRRSLLIPVDLGQHHMRRIGLILHHIKPQHARLGQRLPRIDHRGSQEILDPLRPDPHMNMNDQHASHPATRCPSRHALSRRHSRR